MDTVKLTSIIKIILALQEKYISNDLIFCKKQLKISPSVMFWKYGLVTLELLGLDVNVFDF